MNLKPLSGCCLSLLILCSTLNASEHTNTPPSDNKDALNLYIKYGKPFCYVCLGSIMAYLLYNWYIDKTSIVLHSVEPCQPLPIHNATPETTKKHTTKIVRVTKQSCTPHNTHDSIRDNSEPKMRPTNYLHPAYGQPTTTNNVNTPQEEIADPETSHSIQQTTDAKESVDFTSLPNENSDSNTTEMALDNSVEITAEAEQALESISSIADDEVSHETIEQEDAILSEASALLEDTQNEQLIASTAEEIETNGINNQSSDSANILSDITSAEQLLLDSEDISIAESNDTQENQSKSNEQLYYRSEDASDENTDTDDTDIFSNVDESTGYDSDTEDIDDYDDGDDFGDDDEDGSDSRKYNAIYE